MAAAFKGQRLGVTLMLVLLVGWITVTITTEFIQAAHHGYGSGFADTKQVAPSLIHRTGIVGNKAAEAAVRNNDRDALVAATNVSHGSGFWHDAWRLAATLAVCLLMIFWWYLIMSRSGSF